MKGRNTNEEVVKSITLLTGLCNVKLLVVNPNAEQLSKLLGGVDIKEEPQYIGLDLQKDGNLQNKIVIWVLASGLVTNNGIKEVKEVKTRIEFFVKPEENLSKEGKKQLVNRFGAFSWQTLEQIEANEKMGWFKHPPYHIALNGEELLLELFKNFLNLDTGNKDIAKRDECGFINVNKIMSGDVTELNNYIKAWSNNKVTVLLNVVSREKDGKVNYYQNIHPKFFGRPDANGNVTLYYKTAFANAINGEYGACKGDYQNSLDLKIFNPSISVGDVPDNEAPKSDFSSSL